MFKKLVLIVILPYTTKGMLTIVHPSGATNNYFNSYHWHYHHEDSTTLKTRVNKLTRDNKKLRRRINILEKRVEELEEGTIFSRVISYYGLLGVSAMLSAVMVQYGTGFIEFSQTTIKDVAKDVGVIAACGYGASLMGVASTKAIDVITKNKPNPKLDWILPTAFSSFGFLMSWRPLEKIIFTSPEDVKRMAIGGGLFMATTFLSGAIIHYLHQKWYGNPK